MTCNLNSNSIMNSNSQTKQNLRIAKRMPELIFDIDIESRLIIMKQQKSDKAFVLQYVGSDKNPTNKDLISGIEQAIKYYDVTSARLLIISDPSYVIPEPSSIMKCVMLSLDEIIKLKMVKAEELIRGRKGIHFVAVSRINDTGDQASVGFFKPLE
jgi:hypothetical protein